HHRSALPPSTATGFGGLLGGSLPMRQVYAVLECVSASDAPVLIQGECGTGKELAAEAIHRASARAARPFVVCDAAAASLEAAFAEAEGGTLLLDEIEELDYAAQARLLGALQRPSGHVRILSASSRNLRADVKLGRFRIELYHRLAVVRV